MGIQGLLSFLEKASRPVNISEFSGCTVAIDTYCWLHKGAFSCAEKLARGEPTDQYVNYCMRYVNMLLSHNIKPILVFDGRHLPAKAETEKKRRETRETNRKRAAELLRLERDTEARSLIQRCVDVTHEMASKLMKQCHNQGIDCIVAPYEADSQLAFLNLSGMAHIIITEDSDLMLFGCKHVLFKMDMNGNGILIEQQKIPLAMKEHPNKFSLDRFRYMCILSGCDYLKSLPGIGLAKANKFFKKTVDNDVKRALTRIGAYLNMPNLVVSEDYRDKFIIADYMFKYQPVFDPITRKVVTLNPLPPNVEIPLKDTMSKETSYQLALGNLNPFTLEQVDCWDPDGPQVVKTNGWKTSIQRHKSIWSKEYKLPNPLPPKKDPRDVTRPITNGKVVVQPVATLTEKISKLPVKPNLQEEISKLRESYGIKTPLTTNMYESENETVNEIMNLSKEDEEIFESILKTPEKKQSDNSVECTLDDIFERSPVFDGKNWRNPFLSSKIKGNLNKPGGAIDRFSKLKRTVVEEACIVQSRYFSSSATNTVNSKTNESNAQSTSSSVNDKVPASPIKNLSRKTIIMSKPLSPIKNVFSITNMDNKKVKTGKKSNSSSPGKGNFAVTNDRDADKLNKTIIGSPSPKKNVFAVQNMNDSVASPNPPSFLNIINTLSKKPEVIQTKVEETKPKKKLSSPSFKWQQPLINFNLEERNKTNEGSRKSSIIRGPFLKSPLNCKLSKGKSPMRKRPGTLLESSSFKKKATAPTQPSILEMFAFQPKEKLKTK